MAPGSLGALGSWLRRLVAPGAAERELDEEFQFHVEMQARAHERQLQPPAQALPVADDALLRRVLHPAAAVRVVDVHTLKPFDRTGVCEAAAACRNVLTLEEHNVIGGLGGAVAETCLEAGVAIRKFRRMGIPDANP